MADEVLKAGKSLLTSKTFWLNVVGTVLQVAPVVSGYIPQPYGMLALGVLNILNRLLTNQPITGLLVQ